MQTFRSALVTGASSGIGEQIARVLAERDVALTLVARRQDRLEALAAELRSRVTVEGVAADLTHDDDCARIESRLADHPSTCWSTTPVSARSAASTSCLVRTRP